MPDFVRARPLRSLGAATLLLTLLAPGCGGDDGGGPVDVPDGADTADTADTGADAPDADTDAADSVEPDAATDVPDAGPDPREFEAAPPVDAAEWTLLNDDVTWLVGVTDDSGGTATRLDLERGRFRFPTIGGGPNGVRWSEAQFDEGGRVTNAAAPAAFLAVRFAVGADVAGAILQAEPAVRSWLDGRRRPADLYGGVGVRSGWALDDGEHELVVQAEPRRNAPLARLWTSPDAVVFNTADLTTPQLVAGTTDVQWLGVPVVVLSGEPLAPVRTRVIESDVLEETVFLTPGIGSGATTQMPFELRPKAEWPEEGPITVRVRIEAPQLEASYETTIDVEVVGDDVSYRRTRLSESDHSVQYEAILPPTGPEPEDGWGLVLALHGAAVQAQGHANSYARKDWAVVVAPTNRRPFGFDWEVFGRLDALEALADAKARFDIDPTRVHVTGHSMGGHGTWQLGSLFPTLFATVGPSAGWDSFYSYAGESRPTGVFGRAQASSVTSAYAPTNLQARAVYVIHGDADDNVPVREARAMVDLLEPVVDDLQYHEQPGAGHWWNVDPEPGADCVDWAPLWETMADRRLDPTELDFTFRSPAPWVSATHSFVTVDAVESPMADFVLTATHDGDVVTLTTENVERLLIDGQALLDAGVATVVVDGESVDVTPGAIPVGGPGADGLRKHLGVAGPFNAALHRPFCFVYEAAGPAVYADLAAHWSTEWSSIGNGHACTVTFEGLTAWVEESYQLVFMGVPPQFIAFDGPVAFALAGTSLTADDREWTASALAAAYPYAGRQAALLVASDGREDLLFRYSPFQSRFVVPDFLVWSDEGATAAGFFDATWQLDPSLAQGL